MSKFDTCFIKAALCGIWSAVAEAKGFAIALAIISFVCSMQALYYVFTEDKNA